MYRKRIAADLAKDGFQVTEAERSGVISARKHLSRVAFVRYTKAQTEPSLRRSNGNFALTLKNR